MKALSLWQPWATAIAIGAKRIETRHWSTPYRGPLAIHAAKRLKKDELIHTAACWNWCAALAPLGKVMGDGKYLWDLMPFGAIVATCDLVEVRPTGLFTQAELDEPRSRSYPKEHGPLYSWTERQMGNYELGRFGWVLHNVTPLEKPIPYVGRQGLFNVPDDLVRRAA